MADNGIGSDEDVDRKLSNRSTSRIACDIFRRLPWPLRWCLAIVVVIVLAWFILVPAQSEDAQKAAIRATLGRGTWNMLHRLTVKYPKVPTSKQREDVREFFRLFSWHYPCDEVCAM